MKLLADANIPDEIVDILRGNGHDIIRPPCRATDFEVALLAKKEHRVILTQDSDFANIILFPPRNFHGIIRLKFHPPVISDILQALEDLFQKFSQKNMDMKLIILENDGFRIR